MNAIDIPPVPQTAAIIGSTRPLSPHQRAERMRFVHTLIAAQMAAIPIEPITRHVLDGLHAELRRHLNVLHPMRPAGAGFTARRAVRAAGEAWRRAAICDLWRGLHRR